MRSPFEIFCAIIALARDLLIILILGVAAWIAAGVLDSVGGLDPVTTPTSYCASWEREQGKC